MRCSRSFAAAAPWAPLFIDGFVPACQPFPLPQRMLDMFKRPTDPPEYNQLYAIPGLAMLATYAAGHFTGEEGWGAGAFAGAMIQGGGPV